MKKCFLVSLLTMVAVSHGAELKTFFTSDCYTDKGSVKPEYTGQSLGLLLASAAGAVRNTKSVWNDCYKNGSSFVFPNKNKSSAVGLLLYPYKFAGRPNPLKIAINYLLSKVSIGISVPVAKCTLLENSSPNVEVFYVPLLYKQPQIVMHKHTKYGFMAVMAAVAGYKVWQRIK